MIRYAMHAHATTHTTTSPLSFPLVSSLVCFAFVRAHCVQAASRFIGMEGLLVTDDRDGLPFGVQFVPGETRAGAFYSLEELLPVGAAEGGLALEELPERFSTAPTGQLVSAGLLGAANLGAVLYLGGMLSRLAGVPATALGSAGPLVALLRRTYLPLLVYASGFVGVPAVRAAIVRRKNRKIEERNERRGAWGRVVKDAGSNMRRPEGGLRSRLARKLEAAKKLRPRLRRFREGQDAAYSTAADLADASAKGAELAGSGLDDFDRRLFEAVGEMETPPPSPPSMPPLSPTEDEPPSTPPPSLRRGMQ